VLAARLNVRDKPSVTTGRVLIVITSGATYPAIGRNADSTWFQINANGVIGWWCRSGSLAEKRCR
jgi:hypothetical protein